MIDPYFHLVLTGGLVEGGCDRDHVGFGGFNAGLASDNGNQFGGGLDLEALVIFVVYGDDLNIADEGLANPHNSVCL